MYLHDTIRYRGHDINIYQDENAQSPDEWGNEDVFIVYDHRDFYVKRDGFDPGDIFQAYEDGEDWGDYKIFPLYAYIHSGVSLSLSRGGNAGWYHGAWDTSFKGFVLIDSEQMGTDDEDKLLKIAQLVVDEWNDYLSGNVYGYDVEDIDGCWGYYGDPEKSGMIEEAKSSIDWHIKSKFKKHNDYLKAVIRQKLPLIYRKPFNV